jgi:dolichol kinase
MPHFEETIRKTIHVGSAVFPVALIMAHRLYPNTGRLYLSGILAILAIFLLAFDLLKARYKPFKSFMMRFFGKVLRKNEMQGGMTASTIVVASAAFTILIFREEIAVVALLYLSLGDSAAALVGKHFGRIRLVGQRTLEGSLAALNTCLLVSLFALWSAPEFGWFLTPATLLVGSVVATLSELFYLPLDDNFRIPVFAGLAMELVLPG